MKKGDIVVHIGRPFGVGIVVRTWNDHRGYHAMVQWPKSNKLLPYRYDQLQKLESK